MDLRKMDLKVLNSFLAVCKNGTFTRAAEDLHLSQPALTRQIKDLEDELHCKLFNRNTRSLSLTEKGWQFQKRAKEILELSEKTRQEMMEDSSHLYGVIKIGCVESRAMKWLAEAIKEFSLSYPYIQFQIHSADGDDLKSKLDVDVLDMALLIEPIEAAKYTRLELKVEEQFGFLLKSTDPLAQKPSISIEEMSKLPLIVPRRFIVLDEIKSWLGDPKKKLNVVAYVNLLSNALELVEQELGYLICIEGAFTSRMVPNFTFIPFLFTKPLNHVIARRRNKTLERPAELFWNLLERSLSNNKSSLSE